MNSYDEKSAIEPLSLGSNRLSNGVYNELHISNEDDDGIFSKANRKKSYSQYCAVSAVWLICFYFGTGFSFTTILIPELTKNGTEIEVSKDQVSWISAMNVITIPLGAVVSGPLAQFLGRRGSSKFASVLFMLTWMILYFANSVFMVYLGLLLLGVCSGLVESPVQVYVMEICEPRVRGSASASLSTCFAFGVFIEIVVGSHFYWRTLVLLNLVPLIVALGALHLVPETPYWLASKGRSQEARRSLAWVRGWTSVKEIEDEYRINLDRIDPHEKRSTLSYRSFMRRGVLLPFNLITWMFLVNSFNGQGPIFAYAVNLFQQFESPVDEYTITIVMAGFFLLGMVVSVYVVAVLGKKIPTLWSLAVGGVATLVVAVYLYMYENNFYVTKENYSWWVPVSGVIVSVVATAMGIKVTPWILAGEIFPSDVRGLAAGIIGAVCNVFGAIANKIYQSQVDSFGLTGTFFFFAVVNFVGLGILWCIMPVTEGMTLAEIELLFLRKKDRRRREIEMSPLRKYGWVVETSN